MSSAIIADIEALFVKLKAELSPAADADIKAVENAGHVIVTDAVTYIQTNGLADFEQLAITFVSAMAPGASWVAMLGALKTQAVSSGIKLVEGAEAVVAAKVQADLLAAGTIAPPAA